MNDIGYFIDIERFVNWLYCNKKYIGEDENTFIRPSTCKNWLRYQKLPNDKYINDINSKINETDNKFEKINIAELLICVNNAIDINKGQKLQTITSTGKKVMTLLLLGRILDGQNTSGFFTATRIKDADVWEYLSGFNYSLQKINLFYYLPGRTVSLSQLKSVGKSYKNGMKESAISVGIKELERLNLVKCVEAGKELYKLNFAGCKEFLDNNR